MTGLVAFSFGQRSDELNDPCISNRDLASSTARIVIEGREEGEEILVIAQWEVANALRKCIAPPVVPDLVIWGPRPGKEWDSDEVMAQAADFFRRAGVSEVIVVAFPFLHLPLCQRLARKQGLVVRKRRIGTVRFDKKSTTYWTRSRLGLILYAFRRLVTGRRGPYPPIPTPPES